MNKTIEVMAQHISGLRNEAVSQACLSPDVSLCAAAFFTIEVSKDPNFKADAFTTLLGLIDAGMITREQAFKYTEDLIQGTFFVFQAKYPDSYWGFTERVNKEKENPGFNRATFLAQLSIAYGGRVQLDDGTVIGKEEGVE